MKALKIENLKKIYKGNISALKGISFEVEEGDFFALLGPNGAGKSTTINIITNLTNKTSGEARVFGYDVVRDHINAKVCIGLVPQEFNFNIFEKVFDIIVAQAGFYGIDRKIACERSEKYLKQLNLWEKRNEISQNLSGGMKRKLMIVRALVHEPKLLILDEPTAGVDVETRREMWDFLTDLNRKGITIILTTHYLEEAENLCKNIAIINCGEIIENTSIKSLLSTLDKETFVLDIKPSVTWELKPVHGYKFWLEDKNTLVAEATKEQSLNNLFCELAAQNVNIISLRNKTNRLEELFINLTKKPCEPEKIG